MPIYAVDQKQPQIDDSVWIAPNATIIGDVRIAKGASIWWNAVLRGDNDPIIIGENSNVQDGSILHTDDGIPLHIGANVTIGHMAMLHGCTIGDGSLVGMGAIVLNRALIGRGCLIGAGSIIPEGKEVPDRSLVIGTPGRVIRQLSDEDVANIRNSAEHYLAHSEQYRNRLRLLR